MANESKVIRKTDDSAMALLYEMQGDNVKNILDIDSYYNIDGVYHLLEFIKCDCDPFDYNVNNITIKLHQQLSVIWDFCNKAEGILWIICYNNDKAQFKIINVKNIDEKSIEIYDELKFSFNEFQKWFQKMNSDVLKSK
jgi:hypothetical protein